MTADREQTTAGDLDAELDRLFRGPTSAFVVERNRLVQALRRSGNREEADKAGKLERPSPVAWVINQLHFEAPDLLYALREEGRALREAQESLVGSDAFAPRQRAYQEALRAVMDRALALAEEASLSSSAGLKRRLEMTLGILGAASGDISPPPGRMSAELQPLGFDALTAVAPAPPPRKAKAATKAPEDAARLERVAVVKEALKTAEKELRRLDREWQLSEAARDRAARDVEDAERRADAARSARDEAQRSAEDARGRADAARKQVEQARRQLHDLEG